jgi:hypothetical protein
MRALFDLPRDQRSTQEHPHQQRDHHERGDEELEAVEALIEGVMQQGAILTGCHEARVELVEGGGDPRPGDQQEDTDRPEPDQCREGLRPVLAPGEPDHDPTSECADRTARRVGSAGALDPSRPPR